MAEITSLPTRPLNTPEIPPETWFREDPDWYTAGATVHVKVDGDDEGRAVGLIQAVPGTAVYMASRNHPNYGRPIPDARRFPDGFRTFNRGPIDVVAADGARRQVQVGKLSVWGKHSGEAIHAESLADAVPFLNREGKHAGRAHDIGLIGTASAVETGPHAGAVMFRGMAVPGTTLRDAYEINSTTFSPELWEDPQFGQLVFAGAVRVDHTAFPYDVPDTLAAEADVSAGHGWEVVPTGAGPYIVLRHNATVGSATEPQPDVVAAEHEPGHDDNQEMAEMRSRLTQLEEHVEQLGGLVAGEIMERAADEAFDADDNNDELRELVQSLAEEIELLKQDRGDVTGDSMRGSGGSGLNSSPLAPPGAGAVRV